MPYVVQVQIGSEFKLVEDVAISLGAPLKSIIAKYGGRIQLLNVPNAAPPDAPRIIATTQNFVLNLAPVRYDVYISVPSQIRSDYHKVMDFTSTLFTKLGGELAQLRLAYLWVGLVVNLAYPAASEGVPGIKLSQPIFDRLMSIPRGTRKLAAFQTQYGFEEGPLNKIFSITGYDTLTLNVDPTNLSRNAIRVDKETADVVESGIAVSLDVNNRPAKEHGGLLHDFREILQASRQLFTNLPETLNLKGLISNE